MKWMSDQAEWTEVDHTEVVHDNLDPRYEHHFDVVFNFGQKVHLRFECNDCNADGKVQNIGSCEIDLAELVKCASSEGLMLSIGEGCGELRFLCDESTKARERVVLDIKAANMPSCRNIWAF